MSERIRIAEELLGCALMEGGFAPCPGRDKHSHQTGPRDFRVIVDDNKPPTGFCFHSSCADDVAAFNKQLRRRIWFAENGNRHLAAPKGHWAEGVAPEPKQENEARPELDLSAVWEFTRGVPVIDEDYLRKRSPIDVEGVTSAEYLGHLYSEGDRVLVFLDQRTQGDFIAWKRADGLKTFRLSQAQGVQAVPSALPPGGPEGVWYLVQPVTGTWAVNPNSVKAGGQAKMSRRSEGTVTAWRYFVLESDELPSGEWLKVLANLKMPIAAIYTSGKRSVHALVKYEVPSKGTWDKMRNVMRQLVCPLGADAAALTAVRLSRLPGCTRGGAMQRLIYLNPDPDHGAMWLKPEVRA